MLLIQKKRYDTVNNENGHTSENGQKYYFYVQTVGCVFNRYRLVHWWASEMMLNVQSESQQLPKGPLADR